MGRSSCPNESTFHDPNEITLNIHEYIRNTLLLAICNSIIFCIKTSRFYSSIVIIRLVKQHASSAHATMATAPPPFALHPADAIQGIIDLTTCEGVKLYQNAYTDPADFFNCEAPGLHGFLKQVEGRASRFGWRDAILGSQTIS